MVQVNGTLLDASGRTITEFLSGSPFDSRRVAVEKNGEIVPRRLYDTTVLKDGDIIEIVSFVGGG